MTRPARAFTLIELLLALAVLALLCTLAWPAWLEQVARARRADLQVALYEDAQYLQRYYMAQGVYGGGDPAPRLPVGQAPRTGAAAWQIDLVRADGAGYLLRASRVAGGPMAQDRCGDFTLDDTGARGIEGAATGLGPAHCWR